MQNVRSMPNYYNPDIHSYPTLHKCISSNYESVQIIEPIKMFYK